MPPRRMPLIFLGALALVSCESGPQAGRPAPLHASEPAGSGGDAVRREEAPLDAGAPAIDDAAAPGDALGKIVVVTSDECGFILDQVYFARNTAGLRDAQHRVLDATAEMFRCFLRTGVITKWQVTGNADATERDPAQLSLARAQAVADALVARGVRAATLDVIGAGASDPQDRHGTPEALAKNRRVYFLVLQRGSSP